MIGQASLLLMKSAERQNLTQVDLVQENARYRNTGGVSENNRKCGFTPAFLDAETGVAYPARFADGRPAPMHILDGLPENLILARKPCGAVDTIKPTVIAGFLRRQRFFTRQQAARALRLAERIHARSVTH